MGNGIRLEFHRLSVLGAICAALVSCGGSSDPVYTERASDFTTFSSVTGSVSVRWSGGSQDYIPTTNEPGPVPSGSCVVGLFGDVFGRVDERFVAQPSRVLVACDGLEGAWQVLVVTDNLTRAKTTDSLKFAPEMRGPASGCTDVAMPVTGSISVVEATGDVDTRTIDVPPNYLRRVLLIGQIGKSVCGLDEVRFDVTGEILPAAFNFVESRGSGKE